MNKEDKNLVGSVLSKLIVLKTVSVTMFDDGIDDFRRAIRTIRKRYGIRIIEHIKTIEERKADSMVSLGLLPGCKPESYPIKWDLHPDDLFKACDVLIQLHNKNDNDLVLLYIAVCEASGDAEEVCFQKIINHRGYALTKTIGYDIRQKIREIYALK